MTSDSNSSGRIEPFGSTRTRVEADHALVGPDSHVVSALDGWTDAEGVILISPAMGPAPKGPRFCQYLVHGTDDSKLKPAAAGVERLIYVLDGAFVVDGEKLTADSFVWLPPNAGGSGSCACDSRLLVFEKPYVTSPDAQVPRMLTGTLADAPAEPFMGDEDAMLATLLPTDTGFDMAVNVFTYEPGATLPFVETHIMEHGLYMAAGQGVYRLGESWYPVQKGDTIWMAAYCPQWFVAMGKEPARYIYYKDVNRSPLLPG